MEQTDPRGMWNAAEEAAFAGDIASAKELAAQAAQAEVPPDLRGGVLAAQAAYEEALESALARGGEIRDGSTSGRTPTEARDGRT